VVDGGAPIDEAIDAMSRAVVEGRWLPDAASEERRRALMPMAEAVPWDGLMVSERYMHALALLPG
jgi:beta-N-acetylhexosaminidase